MSLDDAKKSARAAALRRRAAAHAALKDAAPARVMANFIAAFALRAGARVSAYWPSGSELDVRPLMEALHGRGHPIGLPIVLGRGQPLVFRRWHPGAALEARPFGLSEPSSAAGELTPEVLLVPLLAFDREGYRIGHGAGYYDMTLAALRARGPVLAIGVGYAAQGVERLPRAEHDERLDGVVTEQSAMHFPRAAERKGVRAGKVS